MGEEEGREQVSVHDPFLSWLTALTPPGGVWSLKTHNNSSKEKSHLTAPIYRSDHDCEPGQGLGALPQGMLI